MSAWVSMRHGSAVVDISACGDGPGRCGACSWRTLLLVNGNPRIFLAEGMAPEHLAVAGGWVYRENITAVNVAAGTQ